MTRVLLSGMGMLGVVLLGRAEGTDLLSAGSSLSQARQSELPAHVRWTPEDSTGSATGRQGVVDAGVPPSAQAESADSRPTCDWVQPVTRTGTELPSYLVCSDPQT